MKRPSFTEGVVLALVLSVAGSALYNSLATVLPNTTALRALITLIGLSYVLYLLHRSAGRLGRITTATLALPAVAIAGLILPLPLYVLTHLALVWLVRTLYFHLRPLAALADLGITTMALLTATWAMAQTHSLFVSLWCFFLVQALFVFIPRRPTDRVTPSSASDNTFDRAHRNAERALRKLATPR